MIDIEALAHNPFLPGLIDVDIGFILRKAARDSDCGEGSGVPLNKQGYGNYRNMSISPQLSVLCREKETPTGFYGIYWFFHKRSFLFLPFWLEKLDRSSALSQNGLGNNAKVLYAEYYTIGSMSRRNSTACH